MPRHHGNPREAKLKLKRAQGLIRDAITELAACEHGEDHVAEHVLADPGDLDRVRELLELALTYGPVRLTITRAAPTATHHGAPGREGAPPR